VYSLGQIATALDARLVGDPQQRISGLQAIDKAKQGQLSFLSNPRYIKDLKTTQAAAVLITDAQCQDCPVDALVVADPYVAYALISAWFDTRPQAPAGVAPGARVDPSALVDSSAKIATGVVIEAGVIIAAGVEIGPNCVVGANTTIGEGSRLAANVTLYHDLQIGKRNLIHSGAVIGADGFGFANQNGHWLKICQIGRVITGDDVEIGPGTTIDRGAIGDTLIGNGVKLDDQVMIAHNVEIGDDSAIAGCSAVAGSTKIGRRCTVGGCAGIAGHIEIADDVFVGGMASVTGSLKEKGAYASGTGIMPLKQWRRNVIRFQHLDEFAARIKTLEKKANQDNT
jgi:UDP-3-O-[3-hydroxymyristoyl] glucosamine N-acyltransferase